MIAESERHGEEQGPSSVVTVSTPPPTLRLSSSQSLFERKLKGKCFTCGQQGHWAEDCLSTTPTKKASSQPSTPPPDIHLFPVLRCLCGVACTICVARSNANYGRRYYIRNCNCDRVKANRSGKNFYKWSEDVKAPMCKCGAGACTINFQKDSDGNYTKYYTCRIRTGHGSCGFLQFDSPPNSLPRSMEIHKRQSILTPQHETCNLALRKGHRVSHIMSSSDIRSRQIEFQNRISAAGNSSNECKVLQIMGLHVHGWVGRLAFPPPRILAYLPLRHLFCCIFPLFDPILVSGCVDISDDGGSSIMPHGYSNAEVDEVSQNAPRNDTQLLGVPLGTSSRKRPFTAMQEVLTNPMLKEVGKNLPKDLCLLESMEPADHNTMLQAPNGTFDALDSLLIECEPFAEPSRVEGMESAVQDNCNHQVPTIQQNIENCLDGMSGIHAEAFATLTASSNYLQSVPEVAQSVPEVASHFKDILRQIGNLETLLLNIAKDVGQSKRSMLATYQELAKDLKLPPEEVEQCMAWTALDETCSGSSEIYRLLDGRKRQKKVERLQ